MKANLHTNFGIILTIYTYKLVLAQEYHISIF